MNGSVFWRLVWKEYRAQQALWIALAALTLVAQLLLLGLLQPGEEQVDWMFGFALAMAAAYALGCGATLFAAEHESGTYPFQRALPVSAARLFSAKVTFAVLSTLGLMAILWSLSAALAGWRLPGGETHAMIWAGWGFAAVEALVWAMLFSLLLQSPLKAAVLGVSAASLTVHLLAGGPLSLFDGRPYLTVLPWRIALAAVIAALDAWLGRRWFRQSVRASTAGRRIGTSEPDGLPAASPLALRSRGTVLVRLLWQQWRQSGWLVIGLAVVSVLLILPAFSRGLDQDAVLPPFVAASVLAAALIGVYAFHGDQRDRGFRFFAERGIAARDVWLSRQLFWIGLVLVWTFALMVLFLGLGDTIRLARLRPPWAAEAALALRYEQLAGSVAAIALACAAGQLCSMFLRSGILAGVGSLVLTCLLYAWSALMWACGMSWLWSVIPLPFVLLLATWLRAPDWLVERNTWRAWLRPVLALVLPAALLFGLFVFARIHQIPLVDPGFSVEEYGEPASAEARATAQMYLRAIDLYVPLNRLLPAHSKYFQPDEDSQRPLPTPEEEIARWRGIRLQANQEALALALKATERPECDFFDQAVKDLGRDPNRQTDYSALQLLLTMSGEQLEAEGKLDAALERHLAALRYSVHLRHRTANFHNGNYAEESAWRALVHWAGHAQQTPERILAAVPRVEEILKQIPSPEEFVQWEYWRIWREALAEADAPFLAARDWRRAFRFSLASCRLPWERAHTLRLLNYLTAKELQWVTGVESAVARGTRPPLPYWRYAPEDPLIRTSSLLSRWYYPGAHYFLREYLKAETGRRAYRVILALQAWKRAHGGQLPESLDALAGKYLDRLPRDPCAAEPFRYFPKGLPMPVHHRDSLRSAPIVEAGKPFLWATGCFVEGWDANDPTPARYRIRDYNDAWRSPSSEMDVWASGWVYPIP